MSHRCSFDEISNLLYVETGAREHAMGAPLKATPEMVQDYFRLFVNRRAYTLQSIRPHPQSGRHYYYRPKSRTGEALSLDEPTIRRHLEGDLTIALYSINPATQRSKWVAIDADYDKAIEDLLKLQYQLTLDGVQPALEMSKRGGHLWIFMETPLPAKACRIYIYDLALRLNVPVKGAGLPEGIEIFPRHDHLKLGEFGNAIRGPLGVHRGAKRRYWFYGADYSLAAQFAYLKGLRKVTEAEISAFAEGKTIPPRFDKPERLAAPQPTPRPNGYGEFRILDHVRPRPRVVARNYWARCPSCALMGHDRSGDNLAISVDDPRKYRCWAGCTKEMIREALGCPIPNPVSATALRR
jgi:hypothetical protein